MTKRIYNFLSLRFRVLLRIFCNRYEIIIFHLMKNDSVLCCAGGIVYLLSKKKRTKCLNKWNKRHTKKSVFIGLNLRDGKRKKVKRIRYATRIQEIIKCAFNSKCVIALNTKSLLRFPIPMLIKFTSFMQALSLFPLYLWHRHLSTNETTISF